MAVTIERPGASYSRPARKKKRVNWEKWGWLYMRFSGVLLVVLIFGHLFVNLMVGDGIHAIDFAFVGGKLSNPFWQIWDGAMLVLALVHGANGVRTLINDYTSSRFVNRALKTSLFSITTLLIVLGLLVIITFDPCPPVSDPSLVASFCPVNQ